MKTVKIIVIVIALAGMMIALGSCATYNTCPTYTMGYTFKSPKHPSYISCPWTSY